ncbi:PQQ-dependent catabolism-associated CXXCW motif protein [Poseidonocella sp. HB161398]|uniref:PQQ-dependent catabolism-associated CXXCW motif protein n=1 Tax=Poseidonocella sp. HB161398 TaxID=2320855 RepID=UPI00110928F6|nr:PQQ-dependent catabolism-associated CXXCW motif protein [Poseidonocella sp. HB161398]
MIRAGLLLLLALAVPAAAEVAEPEEFRMEEYRAPVPETLAGATVIGTAGALVLWQSRGAAFVDVLPRPPKPDNLPAGTIWHDKPRYSVPGAIWLPNTGYGALAPETEDYLKAGLEQATGGNMDYPLVIFCQADCWMSWNAAKRAVGYGYSAVSWYPEGTDGWEAAELPLIKLEPVPDQ